MWQLKFFYRKTLLINISPKFVMSYNILYIIKVSATKMWTP